MRIGIDAMGGDFAPLNEILGALSCIEECASKLDEILLYGNQTQIEDIAKIQNLDISKLTIVNCLDSVSMHDDPTEILKTKKDSSLYRGTEDLKNKKIDAFASAGNTGATLTFSTILLGRIPGVSRPTIAGFLPTTKSTPTLILDVGATIDQKSRFLFEFALMGSIYFQSVYNKPNPTIGLLNVGQEETKGTDELRDAYKLLKNSSLNFIGNVEGRDILAGTADVVVCDGYVGNVIIKFAESFIPLLKQKVKEYSQKSIISKVQTALSIPVLRGALHGLDYEEYGGVPVLGVNGISVVGHGSSTPKAIKNMIKRSVELANSNLIDKIQSSIKLNT
jgi:glycerol-3-phosphate acyltransferase PlsX